MLAATIVVYGHKFFSTGETIRAQLASSLSLNRTVSRQSSTRIRYMYIIQVVSGITGGMASPRLLRNIIPEFRSLLIL